MIFFITIKYKLVGYTNIVIGNNIPRDTILQYSMDSMYIKKTCDR